MLIKISEQTKIRSIASVMFGRIGKMLFFCPDRIKSFCASLTPFVSGRVFVMLFEGVLVDEGAVAGMAGDAHGGWWLVVGGFTVKRYVKRRKVHFYQSTLLVLGPSFMRVGSARRGRMEASGSLAAELKYRRAISKINLSAFPLLQVPV